jgi:hypothetical protein
MFRRLIFDECAVAAYFGTEMAGLGQGHVERPIP